MRNNEVTIIGWTCRTLTAPSPLSAEALAVWAISPLAPQPQPPSVLRIASRPFQLAAAIDRRRCPNKPSSLRPSQPKSVLMMIMLIFAHYQYVLFVLNSDGKCFDLESG